MVHLKGFIVGIAMATLVAVLWALERAPEPIVADDVKPVVEEVAEESAFIAASARPNALFVVLPIGFAMGYMFVLGADYSRRKTLTERAMPAAKVQGWSQPASPPVDARPMGQGFTRRRRSKPLS